MTRKHYAAQQQAGKFGVPNNYCQHHESTNYRAVCCINQQSNLGM